MSFLRRGMKAAGPLLLCAALAGCRHKQPVAALPAPPAVVLPLDPAVEPPLVAQVPVESAPVLPVVVPQKKVRKPRKKVGPAPAPVVAPAPVELASSGMAPVNAIGALTAGDASPAKRQQALDLLAGVEKRISGQAADWREMQHVGLVRVRFFESQAQSALKGGDPDGAVNLATKAKLLLEDLLK